MCRTDAKHNNLIFVFLLCEFVCVCVSFSAIYKLFIYFSGIPELQLPPMEPLHISEMVLRQGNGGPLNFVATFFNSTLSGMSDYKFSHLQ